MGIGTMWDYFNLSEGEKVACTMRALEVGLEVNVTLPDRISNEQIARFFYERASFIELCGMNRNVGSVIIPIKAIDGTIINICFNRVEEHTND